MENKAEQKILEYMYRYSFTYAEASRYLCRELGYSYKEIARICDLEERVIKQYMGVFKKRLIDRPYQYTNLNEIKIELLEDEAS